MEKYFSSSSSVLSPSSPSASGCVACQAVRAAIIFLGVCTLLYISLRLMSAALRLVSSLLFSRRLRLKQTGQWAVVTGATDGIGKALATELLREGMAVILISRSPERLQNTKKELAEECKVNGDERIRLITADFSAPDKNGLFKAIAAQLQGLDIGILVNNVGLSYPHPMYFDEVDAALLDSLIDVNLLSTYRMTHIVYPGMCERRRGVIVCVGSGASQTPHYPLYCGYVGVKGGIEAFCRSLQAESASRNVIVQCHVPLLVTSKLSKIRNTSFSVPSAKAYARSAMESIRNGKCSPSAVTTICPYRIHRWMLRLSHSIPISFWTSMRLPQSIAIREKALSRKLQEMKRE